jgi:CheY-like chemotaxis protein
MGIDPRHQGNIFEPFFTTTPPDRGTGLGLSTAYGIIQQAGGQIEFDSTPGRGTTFRICLPAAASAMEHDGGQPDDPAKHRDIGGIHDGAPRPLPGRVAAATRHTVLVVEDQPIVRSLIRRILAGVGYEVFSAADGREALEIARQHDGPIDLLLTDVIMPAMTGLELAERFSQVRPAVRTLFMSGYTDGTFGDDDTRMAEIDFLQKPFSADQLLERVQRALREPSPAERHGRDSAVQSEASWSAAPPAEASDAPDPSTRIRGRHHA